MHREEAYRPLFLLPFLPLSPMEQYATTEILDVSVLLLFILLSHSCSTDIFFYNV